MHQNRFFFDWGSAPDPAGELTALPHTSYLYLRGLLLRGGRGKRKRGGKGKGGRGERPYTPPVANFWLRHWLRRLTSAIQGSGLECPPLPRGVSPPRKIPG